MTKKRKTLPKDFDTLLAHGDLAVLKAVFDTCALDAYGGYKKKTALAFDTLPHEMAQWLVAQGADLHALDAYGNTPLHNRARSIFGAIESLLKLGADANAINGKTGTPLHAAATSHNVENTQLLIAYGAQVDAVGPNGLTPMELALQTCGNTDIIKTVALAKTYIKNGAKRSPRMKEFVSEIGKKFEFHRTNFNKETVNEVSDALEELYELFEATPISKRSIHDGKSPILVRTKTWQERHQELWELLVPSSGPAETIQGEVIRISGKIANEIDGNGGANWRDDFNKMADSFSDFVQLGKRLESSELEEVKQFAKEARHLNVTTARMCELAVKWVLKNALPIKLEAVPYTL